MASSLVVDEVILSAAAFQAERRISRYDALCHGRSLGPLVKTRALRDDSLVQFELQAEPLLTVVIAIYDYRMSKTITVADRQSADAGRR